jgi:hypothetical protein
MAPAIPASWTAPREVGACRVTAILIEEILPRLRPILRCVANAEHLYLAFDKFVNNDIGPRRKHQLTGMFRPARCALCWVAFQAALCLCKWFGPRDAGQPDCPHGPVRLPG